MIVQKAMSHVLVVFLQAVPHRCHDLGNLAETCARVLSLDRSLRVSEEQRIRRDRSEVNDTPR